MFPYQRIICSIRRQSIQNSCRALPFVKQSDLRGHYTLSAVCTRESKQSYLPTKPYQTNLFIPTITSSILSNHSTSLFNKRTHSSPNEIPQTTAQKLKKAVAEYGSVVIIFHVGISLISLGICYTLISSGLDLAAIVSYMGINIDVENKLATNTGAFVVAYAVHKVFAPARVGITLTATPFIVKYLRKVGWLKQAPK